MNVAGSVGGTPQIRLFKRRVAKNARIKPQATPLSENAMPGAAALRTMPFASRAQSQADAHFASALRDRLRDQAVDAERGKENREASQGGKERRLITLVFERCATNSDMLWKAEKGRRGSTASSAWRMALG